MLNTHAARRCARTERRSRVPANAVRQGMFVAGRYVCEIWNIIDITYHNLLSLFGTSARVHIHLRRCAPWAHVVCYDL